MGFVALGLLALLIGYSIYHAHYRDRVVATLTGIRDESVRSVNDLERMLVGMIESQDADLAVARGYIVDMWWNVFCNAWALIGAHFVFDAVELGPNEHGDEVCGGCLNEIDTTTCHCGAVADPHVDHSPVAMGCDCHNLPKDLRQLAKHWKERCAAAEQRLRVDIIVEPESPESRQFREMFAGGAEVRF